MSRYYSDPNRESDKWSLPDVEVFYAETGEWHYHPDTGERINEVDMPGDYEPNEAGFYWWFCFPGCMPENEPSGPFDTEEEALANAREMAE